MLEYGAFEAKTHFSELLDKVERGEQITITRRGKPVAILCRFDQHQPHNSQAAFERLRQLRNQAPIRATLQEMQQWKQEGRE
jgi:antitoxin (DNA-binding transcriptional repressor) of toxin-antitoxin stability system